MGTFSHDDMCDYCPSEAKAEKWKALVRIGQSGFRPCPICGRALDTADMVFIDDDGNSIEEVKEAHRGDGTFSAIEYWPDAVECVDRIGIACPCGYCYWSTADYSDMEDDPSWLGRFRDEANRRFGV